ncbi:hypothetical protein [Methylobacterium symbioticum]|uniref:Polymerase nucleotidyl transferase domain-containing protein n=1 Tax=Methylobacterium symbioticum TaxID=2584084 RepID=A0A509EDD5_9HYPH|nr:hypothetical protein [Methylobacterium symbioticum]VUD72287.1 hypothetical protein MET9862_02882 [Methylobacterium symbioticum]
MKTAYQRSCEFSNQKLSELRGSLAGIPPSTDVVLTCGSYARREASEASDLDFFVITQTNTNFDDPETVKADLSWIGSVHHALSGIVPVEPSAGGAFGDVVNRSSLLLNIGGEHDTNHNITRRMLFLLEGEALFNADELRKVRREILERYISDQMTDHQLALFLLNDVIRYYRTMATDYEFKTVETTKPKPWGIRNIKLVFSRKLLYASGLFSVAMAADRTRDGKVGLLAEYFEMPVIDRMEQICGKERLAGVMASYNYFLDKFERPEIREHLKGLRREQRDDAIFRELKNEGHHFTRELLKLFENTFDSTHPIRRAVIF